MELRIGAAIRKLRTNKNVTQEQLAEHLHVSFQAVSKWETGVTVPDVHLLPKLAVYFGVSIDDIFAIDDNEKLTRIMKSIENDPITDESFAYARKALEEILASDETNYKALNAMSWVYCSYANKHNLIAANYAMRAIQADPKNGGTCNAYNALMNALGANTGFQSRSSGQLDMLAFCEPYALENPEMKQLNGWLAEMCIDLRDYKRAEPFMANMLPAHKQILCGDIALASGDEKKAYAIWLDTEESGDIFACYSAGERFNNCNMYEEAIRMYEASFNLTTPPRDLSATYSLAFLYNRLGRYNEALSMWERIIDVMASDYDTTDGELIRWPLDEIRKLQEKR